MSEHATARHTVATAATVAQQLMRHVMDRIRQLPDTWDHMSHGQQQSVIDIIGAACDEGVKHVIQVIAMGGFEHARVGIKSVTGEAEGAKASLLLERDAAIAMLPRAGQYATIVFADPEAYLHAAQAIEAEADQRPLPFEVGGGVEPDAEDAAGRSADAAEGHEVDAEHVMHSEAQPDGSVALVIPEEQEEVTDEEPF